MKLRLTALAGVVTLLAVLFFLRKEDDGPFGWTNWLAPAPNRWERVGQGSSLELIDGPPAGWDRREARQAGTSGARAAKLERVVLDEELRDALGPVSPMMIQFWENAFSGVRSMRRGPDGRIRMSAPSVRSAFPASRREAAAIKPAEKPEARASIVTRVVETVRTLLQRGEPYGKAGGPRRTVSDSDPASARRMDFDGKSTGKSGGGLGFVLGRSDDASVSVGRRPTSKVADDAGERRKKPHVLRLSDWIGRERVEPPKGKLTAPSFSALKDKFPAALPDGKPYSRKTPEPRHFDKLITPGEHPDYEKWLEKDEHRGIGSKPHWHIDARNTPFYHIGTSWGRSDEGNWAWMILSSRRWWTVADEAQRMVRYEENWWWRTQDGWFLLRNGEPWGWRHFADWRRSGLIHPGTGTKIFYSEDGNRIVVSVPGEGSSLFDARTGQFIYRFPEGGRRTAPSEDEIESLEGIVPG